MEEKKDRRNEEKTSCKTKNVIIHVKNIPLLVTMKKTTEFASFNRAIITLKHIEFIHFFMTIKKTLLCGLVCLAYSAFLLFSLHLILRLECLISFHLCDQVCEPKEGKEAGYIHHHPYTPTTHTHNSNQPNLTYPPSFPFNKRGEREQGDLAFPSLSLLPLLYSLGPSDN